MLTDCWEVCREVVFFVFVCDAGLGFAFVGRAVWFSGVFAGIRKAVFAAQVVLVFLHFRWHPRFAFVLHASPLCGAAPTFLCR
ncbi:hypothetical protein SB861_53480, partial [Paraburkholderia sp. SIMBA_049]